MSGQSACLNVTSCRCMLHHEDGVSIPVCTHLLRFNSCEPALRLSYPVWALHDANLFDLYDTRTVGQPCSVVCLAHFLDGLITHSLDVECKVGDFLLTLCLHHIY